jgi:tetraacyldisaccharide 4'-kinase
MADARGPLPRWLAPATFLMARCYGAGVAWRNARFDRGVGVARLDAAPVVSIGNLTAGGTGKSPFVAWCAGVAASSGITPVIAMRGYRATGDGASDEAREYAETASAARVVVGARRREALEAAFAQASEEPWAARTVVLLDDGFQHRQLARDLDIVLVDATRPALDGDLLPNGWLREPARNIARASLVVLTKADADADRARAAALVAQLRGRAHDAACVHRWRALAVAAAGSTRTEAVGFLAGKSVVSACALGNPAHFHAMVERAGAQVAERIEKPDHRAFTASELDAAVKRAGVECVVTSRKDFVKLDRAPAAAVVVPELEVAFIEGEERVRAALAAGFSARGARSSA